MEWKRNRRRKICSPRVSIRPWSAYATEYNNCWLFKKSRCQAVIRAPPKSAKMTHYSFKLLEQTRKWKVEISSIFSAVAILNPGCVVCVRKWLPFSQRVSDWKCRNDMALEREREKELWRWLVLSPSPLDWFSLISRAKTKSTPDSTVKWLCHFLSSEKDTLRWTLRVTLDSFG